jgi:hypothetical protein
MRSELQFGDLTFAENGVANILWIEDDGGNFRETRPPGADMSDLPPEAQAEAAAVWTPEVIADYEAAQSAVADADAAAAAQVLASQNFVAMIERRAEAMARAGDTVGALVLLHTIGK